MRNLYTLFAGFLIAGLLLPQAAVSQESTRVDLEVMRQHTSGPLHDMAVPEVAPGAFGTREILNRDAKPMKFGSVKNLGDSGSTTQSATTIQTENGTTGPAKIAQNFEGASDADNGAVTGFLVVPPDTDGDVGPRHYVQWINLVAEIFDKRGNTIMGPFPGNLFFQGLGGICEATNDGDPIVLYDEEADRWNVSQFALDFTNNTYSMCIAISATGDPTGSYHQYELSFGNIFPDYPKLGIWGDSYTMTTRNFIDAAAFGGQWAIALERDAMLNGETPGAVAFAIPTDFFSDGYLPMDADDRASGPALFGGVDKFNPVRSDTDRFFELFALDVDWANPAAATFTQVADIQVPDFDFRSRPYIFQPNGQPLDDLDGFTMHRAQVRRFDSHTSMVVNHTVVVGAGTAAVRWYEFRESGSGWELYQHGTYSPDNDDRWMASIAMNGRGDIAIGYSRTSSKMHPSIYVAAQTSDYSGTGIMNVGETLIHAGGGSQEAASRWGDYSMMSVDPKDDRTFWYTTEYYAETGAFDFKTRIAAFRMPVTGSSATDATAEANRGAFDQLTLGVDEVPTEFGLGQNHPNPFNPTTMLNFAMPQAGHVTVRVYNLLGQEVATLVNEVRDAGNHTVAFDASRLSSGIYLYVMQSGNYTATKRMTLLK